MAYLYFHLRYLHHNDYPIILIISIILIIFLIFYSWDSIVTLTAAQKDNLRTASLQFQKIDNGVKDVMHYLKEIEQDVDNDRSLQPDEAMMKTLLERYQVKIFLSDFKKKLSY